LSEVKVYILEVGVGYDYKSVVFGVFSSIEKAQAHIPEIARQRARHLAENPHDTAYMDREWCDPEDYEIKEITLDVGLPYGTDSQWSWPGGTGFDRFIAPPFTAPLTASTTQFDAPKGDRCQK
jgi:hypothetical protein